MRHDSKLILASGRGEGSQVSILLYAIRISWRIVDKEGVFYLNKTKHVAANNFKLLSDGKDDERNVKAAHTLKTASDS